MKEIYITEEELDYYNTPTANTVSEATVPYKSKSQLSFEEESKDCITLEEFGRMWKESIDNDPRFV